MIVRREERVKEQEKKRRGRKSNNHVITVPIMGDKYNDLLCAAMYNYFCGKCKSKVQEKQNYCPACGKSLNWENIIENGTVRFWKLESMDGLPVAEPEEYNREIVKKIKELPIEKQFEALSELPNTFRGSLIGEFEQLYT